MPARRPAWTPEQAREAVAAYEHAGIAPLAKRFGLHPLDLRRRLVEAGAVIRAPGVQPPSLRAAHGDKVRARHAADPGLRERLADGGRAGAAVRFAHLRRMSAGERAEYDRLTRNRRFNAAEALAVIRGGRGRTERAAAGGR